jgi:hypothetical protein
MSTRVKDDRPVEFATLVTIGNSEMRGCTRCGSVVIRADLRRGDVMERVHRKWHEETEGASHGGCATISEHHQLQQQVAEMHAQMARLIQAVTRLAEGPGR